MRSELEQVLKDYYSGELATRIEIRKLELAYPSQIKNEANDRVSESGGVGSPTEQVVIKRVMDLKLATLERRMKCIEKFLTNLEGSDRVILEYRYRRQYRWFKIAQLVSMSKATCHPVRSFYGNLQIPFRLISASVVSHKKLSVDSDYP